MLLRLSSLMRDDGSGLRLRKRLLLRVEMRRLALPLLKRRKWALCGLLLYLLCLLRLSWLSLRLRLSRNMTKISLALALGSGLLRLCLPLLGRTGLSWINPNLRLRSSLRRCGNRSLLLPVLRLQYPAAPLPLSLDR